MTKMTNLRLKLSLVIKVNICTDIKYVIIEKFSQKFLDLSLTFMRRKWAITHMEQWREIYPFPGYSVSSMGRVRNDDTDYILALMRNQQGIIHVGLTRDRVQIRRAVAPLVAKAFLPEPMTEAFDTPINLDGDRSNNIVENLVWRPRWFAIKYFRQFVVRQYVLAQRVEEVKTGEQFDTSWIAAIRNGLIHKDLVLATLGFTPVWPTNQRFRIINADIE